VTLARPHGLPIVPRGIFRRGIPGCFTELSKHSTELRDHDRFHELLQQGRPHLRFTVGEAILPEDLDSDRQRHRGRLNINTVHGLAGNPGRRSRRPNLAGLSQLPECWPFPSFLLGSIISSVRRDPGRKNGRN